MSGPSVLLIGCGKMGSALLEGWLAHGIQAGGVAVVEPFPEEIPAGVACYASIGGLQTAKPEVVILAVKPQQMDQVLQECSRSRFSDAVFLSIAAGKRLAYLEKFLGKNIPAVRAMPNLPALVGKGITVMIANQAVSQAQKAKCGELLEAVGAVRWLENEDWMDAVTAISGSGPAYAFYFQECLARAGSALGLPVELSEELARKTLAGSAAMLEESGESASVLRQRVTSPGGTTEAALAILMKPETGMEKLFKLAAEAAKRRSQELSR